MKNYIFTLIFFFQFIGLFMPVSAENDYYIVAIKRKENDENYDSATSEVKKEIDKLVNDRMNDIYDIIDDNKKSFILENGLLDNKLQELENHPSAKRDGRKRKFKFINRIIPDINSEDDIRAEDTEYEYIPLASDLVNHICPVLNYYTVRAYLSDNIVDKVRQLSNVVGCIKSSRVEDLNCIRSFFESSSNSYYDIDEIKKETKWSDVSVQENALNHLSLISQGISKNDSGNDSSYDNNYYYPSTAGQGVDIFIIDEGIYTNHEDFDTYKGKSYERTVACDAIVIDGSLEVATGEKKNKCFIDSSKKPNHGFMVSSTAAGTIYGVAKKANIHMIATGYTDYEFMAAIDYIKRTGKPHKTLINVSRGGFVPYSSILQDKITELVNNGFIIFAAAGNTGYNFCFEGTPESDSFIHAYSGYNGVISVGAIKNDETLLENIYQPANYTNYGKCIDLLAPGSVHAATFDKCTYSESEICNEEKFNRGTSFSSPIVAGVAATIISEHLDTAYDYESMKKTLIDLSIKDGIKNLLDETPNRFVNNGKRKIYHSNTSSHTSTSTTSSLPSSNETIIKVSDCN